jgi:hypothetical protein
MRRPFFLALPAIVLAIPAAASAQNDGELRLMREPHSYVDVVDAFDDDDPFDVNLSVNYRHMRQWGVIQRERGSWTPGPGDDPNRLSRLWENVAHHEHVQNILEVGLDVGLFRDLALYARLPIILSDDRSLERHDDFRTASADRVGVLDVDNATYDETNGMRVPPTGPSPMDGRVDLDTMGMPMAPLFDLGEDGFRSPTRSGLDYVAVGLAWSIFNQHREAGLPTWVLMLEGRFNPLRNAGGEPLTACRDAPSGPACRIWTYDEGTNTWGSPDDTGTNAGMSRGTNALHIETRASWRTRYLEPYGGLMFQIDWPGNAEDFFTPAGNLSGFINDRPPIQGEITGGMAIIPWEDRGSFQRLAIDLRFNGRYVSEGHTYSPLFDALGTSRNPYLTSLTIEGTPGGDARSVPFFGLTDVASHAELGARVGVEVYAARYVRFGASAELWYISPYTITFADACNPNVENISDTDPRRGTCRRGIVNAHHRPVIDLPGQRFRVDEQIRLDISLAVTGQF